MGDYRDNSKKFQSQNEQNQSKSTLHMFEPNSSFDQSPKKYGNLNDIDYPKDSIEEAP